MALETSSLIINPQGTAVSMFSFISSISIMEIIWPLKTHIKKTSLKQDC